MNDARSTRIATIAVAIFFGLLFAFNWFQALSSLFQVPAYYESRGVAAPWALLISWALLAPVAFVLSTWIGHRLRVPSKALVYLVGLSTVWALSFGLLALELAIQP